MSGPLHGIRVIEIAGMGAGPYAGMLLGDLGADVIRVDRPGPPGRNPREYALSRSRRSVQIDLKSDRGLAALMTLVERADILFEGFRPGVAERLGFGPEACLSRRPSLVYGRMTGWGQDGPMSQMAGHDLNYLGLTGALTLFQRDGRQPATPPGFVADLGGGGLMLALGLVSGVVSARATGQGQVVDAAMVDGVASLTTLIHSMSAQGRWDMDRPGTNFCDGGAPYYDSYVTSDGLYMAVAPIEPQFYAVMVKGLGLSLDELPDRDDPANWEPLRRVFGDIFRTRTRAEWTEVFDGTDACVTPVLGFGEAPTHPHHVARGTYAEASGATQPSPAPRFSATPGSITAPPPLPGEHSEAILREWGVDEDEIDRLVAGGVIIQA
ncbi:MAG: CaiB/BaiF CoA-transferase family protein [Aeromicrobium sp.]